jgi:mannosyl-oligosaccharide alpha-1,2-mannosidase
MSSCAHHNDAAARTPSYLSLYLTSRQVGTFSLEFRALSSALGNPTLACIADKMQSHIVGNVSSPWPLGENLYHHTPIHTAFDSVNGSGAVHGTVSFGSGNDSFYEYLLKSHLIMPRENPQLYVELYRRLARQLNFEYGLVNDDVATQGTLKLLFAHRGRLFLSRHPGGTYHVQLACFLPGLMMLGAMMLPDRATARDQIIAEKLLDGCLWTYTEPSLSQHGLGADFIDLKDVQNSNEDSPLRQQNEMNEQDLRLPGVHKYSGEYNYYLRPETVESVFLAWRTTRDPKWRKAAWDIFTGLKKLQARGGGFHGIVDVTLQFNSSLDQNTVDEQPSYFIAETLKYLFLTFDDPERLSLKDWVFSTECHPLRLLNNHSSWSIRSCAV